VSCDFSTTPLKRGCRGGLNVSPTPSPASHSASAVGSSLQLPHGQPLSSRSAPGSPHRPNHSPSCARTEGAGTWFQTRGGNGRAQHGPGALVGGPQPTDQGPVPQPHLVGGVELP